MSAETLTILARITPAEVNNDGELLELFRTCSVEFAKGNGTYGISVVTVPGGDQATRFFAGLNQFGITHSLDGDAITRNQISGAQPKDRSAKLAADR